MDGGGYATQNNTQSSRTAETVAVVVVATIVLVNMGDGAGTKECIIVEGRDGGYDCTQDSEYE